MAEALGVASGVIQILSASIALCQTIAQTVDQIQNAPKHISAIASDLRAFYGILSTIQDYLDEEETSIGVLHPTTSGDIQQVLGNCMKIFQEFHAITTEYLGTFGSKAVRPWQRVKWTWKDKEVTQLRDQLGAHKITLNVAIATANLINTTKTDATTDRIEADVHHLKSTLTLLLQRLAQMEERSRDQDVMVINYEATLCRVAQDATSILSSVSPEAQPSFNLSLERVVSTLASCSSFETAPLIPLGAKPSSNINPNVSPDLEYTGSFFTLTVYFQGIPQHVQDMKQNFRQKALSLSTMTLSTLCREVLQELTLAGSAAAKMEFYFYDQMFSLSQLGSFLTEHVDMMLPASYAAGDLVFLPPSWLYTLHSLNEESWGPYMKKTSVSDCDSNRWRMSFVRAQTNNNHVYRHGLAHGVVKMGFGTGRKVYAALLDGDEDCVAHVVATPGVRKQLDEGTRP